LNSPAATDVEVESAMQASNSKAAVAAAVEGMMLCVLLMV